MLSPNTVNKPSGLLKSLIRPKLTPLKASNEERKLYAAIKNGICSNKDVAPLKTYVGL